MTDVVGIPANFGCPLFGRYQEQSEYQGGLPDIKI